MLHVVVAHDGQRKWSAARSSRIIGKNKTLWKEITISLESHAPIFLKFFNEQKKKSKHKSLTFDVEDFNSKET